MGKLLIFLSVLLVGASSQADTFRGVEMKPELTPSNGLSCGRTPQHDQGVPCDASQCYDPAVAAAFPTWDSFESGFLKSEVGRSGVLNLPMDFSDVCPGFKRFSREERENLFLDFLKMMVAFESNFETLVAYDDLVDGKVDTGRGFFSVGVSNCQEFLRNGESYCKIHDPRVNTTCSLGIIGSLMKSSKGKSTINALGRHWGSLRSPEKNAIGGRQEEVRKMFAKHAACGFADSGVKYDRLKKEMWTDSDWARGKIVPSAKSSVKDACDLDQKVEVNQVRCRKIKNWEHYSVSDQEYSAAAPR